MHIHFKTVGARLGLLQTPASTAAQNSSQPTSNQLPDRREVGGVASRSIQLGLGPLQAILNQPGPVVPWLSSGLQSRYDAVCAAGTPKSFLLPPVPTFSKPPDLFSRTPAPSVEPTWGRRRNGVDGVGATSGRRGGTLRRRGGSIQSNPGRAVRTCTREPY